MNLKRSLIGLFFLFFLISGIGLGLLVLDDKNDLSSRASIGLLPNLLPPVSEERLIENDSLWDGSTQNIPFQIDYDKRLWQPSSDEPVFFHLQNPTTVRVHQGSLELKTLVEILGDSFTQAKVSGNPISYIEGWSTQRYTFRFYGEERSVDVWESDFGITLIAVTSDSLTQDDIVNLASNISAPNDVKGASTTDDSARLAASIRPSVVMILNRYCAQLKYNESAEAPFVGKSYPFCLAQAGSGFFVNKDGYIATNGHVVTNLPESSLILGVAGGALDNFLVDFFQAYLSSQTTLPVDRSFVEQKVKEAHLSKETIYQMAAVVYEMLIKNLIKIDNSESSYYVQLSNTPIQLSKEGVNLDNGIVTATFIDADYKLPDDLTGFASSDVALIKVEGDNFPALPLGKIEDVRVGSELLVVGYPGVVMGSQSLLLDTSANAEPTFTKGVVSAFKQAKGNLKNLIQTDASINHGNSGGPAMSTDGKVVGIATYGLDPGEGGGNYNFLRDIADLKALMVKNNVSEDAGEVYSIWNRGLGNYWLSYFKYARSDFEKVTALYEGHPTAADYLEEADAKIGTPEDKTPRFTRSERKLFMNMSGGTMAFSIIAIIILAISDFIDSKRRRTPASVPPRPNIPAQPVQTF